MRDGLWLPILFFSKTKSSEWRLRMWALSTPLSHRPSLSILSFKAKQKMKTSVDFLPYWIWTKIFICVDVEIFEKDKDGLQTTGEYGFKT